MGASTSISHRHHMQGRGSKSGPGGDGMRRWSKPPQKFQRRTFKPNVLDHMFVPVLGWGWVAGGGGGGLTVQPVALTQPSQCVRVGCILAPPL